MSLLAISGFVDTASIGPALDDVRTVLRTLSADGLTEAERDTAVQNLVGVAPLRYERAASVASTLADQVEQYMPPLREVSGTCRARIPVPAPLLRASIRLQQGWTGPPGCRQASASQSAASRQILQRCLRQVLLVHTVTSEAVEAGSGVAWRTSAGHLAGHNVPRRAR